MITVICLLCCVSNAEEVSFKTIGVHYSLTDVVIKPVSIGIVSWTCDEYNTVPGVFGSICCLSHKNIRLELGAAFTIQDRFDVVPLTGVSFPISESIIVGAWYAPFWNLYSPNSSDDPFGMMVGYRF